MTAAEALARIKEHGTLASGPRPANALIKDDVNAPVALALNRAVTEIGKAGTPRWLAPATDQVMLP